MNIISILHKNKLHNEAHYKPYLARYHENSLTLIDHYRHLKQLLDIYKKLEELMSAKSMSHSLPQIFIQLLQRSKQIAKDLLFLERYVPLNYHAEITHSASQYVSYLDSLNKESNDEIFTHYLIRILGDLFGGQNLRDCIITLYKRNNLFDIHNPEQGVSFYCFEKDALKNFSDWLRKIQIDEQKIDTFGTLAYQKNIAIFDELESTRITTKQTQNYCNFFKKVAAGAAVVAGSAILATTYTRYM